MVDVPPFVPAVAATPAAFILSRLAMIEWDRKEFRRALAREGAHVSPQTVSRWIAGGHPRPKHLAAMLRVFRLDAEEELLLRRLVDAASLRAAKSGL